MPINFGNQGIVGVHVGETEITGVYLGSQELFHASHLPPFHDFSIFPDKATAATIPANINFSWIGSGAEYVRETSGRGSVRYTVSGNSFSLPARRYNVTYTLEGGGKVLTKRYVFGQAPNGGNLSAVFDGQISGRRVGRWHLTFTGEQASPGVTGILNGGGFSNDVVQMSNNGFAQTESVQLSFGSGTVRISLTVTNIFGSRTYTTDIVVPN